MSNPSRTKPAAYRVGKLHRLTRRADYVATAKGRRFHSESLSLQAAERPVVGGAGGPARARFGLTVSRKVGNSVVRSRVKRRLREAIRQIEATSVEPNGQPQGGLPDPKFDYVIVARTPALTRPFDVLVRELAADLVGVHQPRRAARDKSPGAGPGPRPYRTRGHGPSSETR
jgi:ribonuclease P protein component